MRFPLNFLPWFFVGAAACGPTYVVQSTPSPAPQRAPEPPRVEPLRRQHRPTRGGHECSSRPAVLRIVAVFEIVPGRGVSLVYPRPMQPRDVAAHTVSRGSTSTGLCATTSTGASRPTDTRYIYAVGVRHAAALRRRGLRSLGRLERRLGSTFYSTSPNATVRAISREFVRAQPDEWWGEDMFSMSTRADRDRVTLRSVWARVYCPGGNYFEVREDSADHVWCPSRDVERAVGRR